MLSINIKNRPPYVPSTCDKCGEKITEKDWVCHDINPGVMTDHFVCHHCGNGMTVFWTKAAAICPKSDKEMGKPEK